jgi:hypothetical protein
LARRKSFNSIARHSTVAAYEDVTVPAGTFKAFRIDQTPIANESINSWTWYSPQVKLIVKRITERTPHHYLGAGRTTTELLSLPQ